MTLNATPEYSDNLKNKGIVEEVLNCQVKDPVGLNDFQRLPTQGLVAIQKVGINRFRLPIEIAQLEGGQHHDAVASMSVALNEKKNGVSMSRLCLILQQEAQEKRVDANFLQKVLNRYQNELTDEEDLSPIEKTYLSLQFSYAQKQPSLKSQNWGWQYYPVTLKGSILHGKFHFYMSVDYEYSSTCPCSLSMAKQYESQYAQGKTREGTGVAVAHGQRSKVRCTVKLVEQSTFFIDDLLTLLRQAIPTETQSLVKRQDEQAFAVLNGMNPMFVEHVGRRLYHVLNLQEQVEDWHVEIEHYESLHSHNAAAVLYKGVPGGLAEDHIF